ncbi:MAG: hypothetical protein LDL56_00580 [Armatimonadetes bacterium]|nr:hypothetical protein [Armatimonadota bacterium]MCA1995705.1 hypothetical protein [Armatimonadota bacterium]
METFLRETDADYEIDVARIIRTLRQSRLEVRHTITNYELHEAQHASLLSEYVYRDLTRKLTDFTARQGLIALSRSYSEPEGEHRFSAEMFALQPATALSIIQALRPLTTDGNIFVSKGPLFLE